MLEYIKPEDADTDFKALLTIISGRRGVGTINLEKNDNTTPYFLNAIKHNNLHLIKIEKNPNDFYVVYAKGYEERAKELADIADSYGGYLYYKATEKDTRRIGELLEYDPQDVESFIKKVKT